MRLDNYLFSAGHTASRNRAKELICNGKIKVDGLIVTKPAFVVDMERIPEIEILEEVVYVSRAAGKLKSFLAHHPLEIRGKRCLDIGSSTGGFVQVLLEHGAQSVTAVDVGSDQLHPSLRELPQVISVEQTDIRQFQTDVPFDIVTCDVSFVGIAHILPDIDRLAKSDIVLLFKPQFEVGRDVRRTRKGVVKNQKAIEMVKQKFLDETFARGWCCLCEAESEIKGKEGNAEIFFHFQKR